MSDWIPCGKHCYTIFVAHVDLREHFDSSGRNVLSAVHSDGDIWQHCTCFSLVDLKVVRGLRAFICMRVKKEETQDGEYKAYDQSRTTQGKQYLLKIC